jgi:hypothetical protein
MCISKEKMKEMKDRWARKNSMSGVPAGTYEMQLQSAALKEAKSSGKLGIHREHLILSGDQEGEVVFDQLSLETDRGPYFIARWIEQMGFAAPDDVSELEEVVRGIADEAPSYTAKVTLSEGGFTNVNIIALLDGNGGDAGDDGAGTQGELDLDALQAFATAYNIEGDSEEEIIAALDECAWSAADLTEDEILLLQAAGIVVDGADEASGDPVDDADAEQIVLLVAFAEAQGADLGDVETLEDVVTALDGYEWTKKGLKKAEVEMLQGVGIEVK